MAKARKARKNLRNPAAKRAAKKRRRIAKAAETKPKARKAARPKRRRAAKPKEGPIEEAVHAVMDTITETAELRRRLAGRETFED